MVKGPESNLVGILILTIGLVTAVGVAVLYSFLASRHMAHS